MKDRIRELRKILGLTQQKFADRLGLKRQTIAAYEMGNIEPSESTMLLMCKEFGASKQWLETGIGEPTIKRTRKQEIGAFFNEAMDLPDENIKNRLINALANLDERDWETIEKIVDGLKRGD